MKKKSAFKNVTYRLRIAKLRDKRLSIDIFYYLVHKSILRWDNWKMNTLLKDSILFNNVRYVEIKYEINLSSHFLITSIFLQ